MNEKIDVPLMLLYNPGNEFKCQCERELESSWKRIKSLVGGGLRVKENSIKELKRKRIKVSRMYGIV